MSQNTSGCKLVSKVVFKALVNAFGCQDSYQSPNVNRAVLASYFRTPLIRNRVNDFNMKRSLDASEASGLAVFKTSNKGSKENKSVGHLEGYSRVL